MKRFHPLIMASTSKARRAILKKAGLKLHFQKPLVDEKVLREEFSRKANSSLTAEALAQILADSKASSITAPDAIVIGADQTLEFNGQIFGKAHSINDARRQLQNLRGQTHELYSAVTCTRNGQLLFQHVDTASMTMRYFSDPFLDIYLANNQTAALSSVGCYFYEAGGIQLFEKVEGDYYTILGLALLPLLAFLRNEAMIAT